MVWGQAGILNKAAAWACGCGQGNVGHEYAVGPWEQEPHSCFLAVDTLDPECSFGTDSVRPELVTF